MWRMGRVGGKGVWSILHGVYFCTFVHSYLVHFIVHLTTLWVQLGGWTTVPSQKCSIQFSVGLSQPAYAFVRDMSVLTKSIEPSQASEAHFTHPHFVLRHLHRVICPTVLRPRANNVIIGSAPTNQHKDRKSTPPPPKKKQLNNNTNKKNSSYSTFVLVWHTYIDTSELSRT